MYCFCYPLRWNKKGWMPSFTTKLASQKKALQSDRMVLEMEPPHQCVGGIIAGFIHWQMATKHVNNLILIGLIKI
jgi:hypothetical protein